MGREFREQGGAQVGEHFGAHALAEPFELTVEDLLEFDRDPVGDLARDLGVEFDELFGQVLRDRGAVPGLIGCGHCRSRGGPRMENRCGRCIRRLVPGPGRRQIEILDDLGQDRQIVIVIEGRLRIRLVGVGLRFRVRLPAMTPKQGVGLTEQVIGAFEIVVTR